MRLKMMVGVVKSFKLSSKIEDDERDPRMEEQV